MRTTYYHYIDGSVGIGTTYHTLATGTVNEFGIGISSHIGIGTIPRTGADLAIHHDGSESKRTGGLEINANSDSAGDKHGARILSYNRIFTDKGFRRLRFSASEFQFETPRILESGEFSRTSIVPTFNITGFGSVGIGTTNPTQILHLSSNSNQASIRLSNVGTGGTDWYVQSSGNDASNGRGNFSIYNGAINDYALSITAEGNVGIGTTTPTSPLTIFKEDPQYVGVSTVLTLRTFRSDMSPSFPAGGSIKFDNYDGNYGHEAFIEVIAPESHSGSEASREKTADFNFKQTNNGTLNTRFTIKGETGNIVPGADNTQDLGSSSLRWANVYTGDMHLNNMNTGGNEVDGSEGHWTLQEGSDDLFLINRNTGKKYKFNLTEVS